MKRLIIFLIRRRLKLKKGECFQFANQKTSSVYWFTSKDIQKVENGARSRSSVSLNWLLDDECVVVRM